MRQDRRVDQGNQEPKNLDALEAVKSSRTAAAAALTAFVRCEEGDDAEMGALLVAEFMLRVISFLEK